MEKQVVKTITNSMPNVFSLFQKKGSFHFAVDYDKEADVMYVSFDDKKEADDSEVYNDDIVLRKRNNTIIGMTILHASSAMGLN